MKTRWPESCGILWKLPLGILLLGVTIAAGTDEWKAPARATMKKNPLKVDEQILAVGKEIYVGECAPCHGAKGRGDGVAASHLDPPPRDFTATSVARQTDGALFWKIGEGHTPMPGFKNQMSEDGRWHVVCYVRSLVPAAAAATQPAAQP